MGYYLMKCRIDLKEILAEILKPTKYDDITKSFYLEATDIKKIDDVFYKYGFSDKVKDRELETNKLRLNRETQKMELIR